VDDLDTLGPLALPDNGATLHSAGNCYPVFATLVGVVSMRAMNRWLFGAWMTGAARRDVYIDMYIDV